MIPNITRGADFHGLMRYLVGPGKANEHTDPHLVGGDVSVTLWAGRGVLTAADAMVLADRLATPLAARGSGPKAGAVWHCSLSVRAEDGQLGEVVWGRVAGQFMAKMGWADPTSGVADMPWLAIHHGGSTAGNDHIHLVVSMVRDDGLLADTSNDFQRAQTACRQIETELELTPLQGPTIGVGSRGLKAGELNKAVRDGGEPARVRLERAVRGFAAMADSEEQFIAALRGGGVRIAPFYAAGGDAVTGYKVRLVGEGQRWYGGGKLARDLTLPRLRLRWSAAEPADPAALAAWRGEKVADAGWPAGLSAGQTQRVLEDLRVAGMNLQRTPADRLETWAHVSADLAGVFAAWSLAAEGDRPGPLARAATAAGRLAQLHRRSITGKPAPRTVTSGAARVAYQLGTAGQSAAAQALLLAQLVATMHALYEAAKALGQARTAEQLAVAAQQDLATVTARLQLAHAAAGPTSPERAGGGPDPDADLAGLPPELATGIRAARQAGLLPRPGQAAAAAQRPTEHPTAGQLPAHDQDYRHRTPKPRPGRDGGAQR